MTRLLRSLPVAAVGVLAACASSDRVDAGEVEEAVREALTAEVGQEPESVEYDGDLPAEVGASIRCILTATDGVRIGVTVSTTSVDGDDVDFEILVDDEVVEE